MGYLVAFTVLLLGGFLIYNGLQGTGVNLATTLLGHTPATAGGGAIEGGIPPGFQVSGIPYGHIANIASSVPGVIS